VYVLLRAARSNHHACTSTPLSSRLRPLRCTIRCAVPTLAALEFDTSALPPGAVASLQAAGVPVDAFGAYIPASATPSPASSGGNGSSASMVPAIAGAVGGFVALVGIAAVLRVAAHCNEGRKRRDVPLSSQPPAQLLDAQPASAAASPSAVVVHGLPAVVGSPAAAAAPQRAAGDSAAGGVVVAQRNPLHAQGTPQPGPRFAVPPVPTSFAPGLPLPQALMPPPPPPPPPPAPPSRSANVDAAAASSQRPGQPQPQPAAARRVASNASAARPKPRP
jgi:hypothetical protein